MLWILIASSVLRLRQSSTTIKTLEATLTFPFAWFMLFRATEDGEERVINRITCSNRSDQSSSTLSMASKTPQKYFSACRNSKIRKIDRNWFSKRLSLMQLSLELNKPEWRAGITLKLWSFRLMPFTKTKKSIKMFKDRWTAATAASAFVSIQSFVWRLRHFSTFRNFKKFIHLSSALMPLGYVNGDWICVKIKRLIISDTQIWLLL